MRSLLATIQFDELTIGHNKCYKVVSDLRLVSSDRRRLSLRCIALVNLLETIVAFKTDAPFHWRFSCIFRLILAKNRVWDDSYPGIKDSVDACDDTTCVVQSSRLLHVIVDHLHRLLRTSLTISLLVQDLDIQNDCEYRLRQKGQKLFVKSKNFSDCNTLVKTYLVKVICEDLGVRFEWWPLEFLTSSGKSAHFFLLHERLDTVLKLVLVHLIGVCHIKFDLK